MSSLGRPEELQRWIAVSTRDVLSNLGCDDVGSVVNFQLFYRDPKARRQLAKVIINRYYVDNQPFFIGANDTKRVQLKLSSNFIDRNIFTNELRLAGIMVNSIKTESVIERKDIIERYVDTIFNNANLRRSFETWLNQGSAYSCSFNSSATFETTKTNGPFEMAIN